MSEIVDYGEEEYRNATINALQRMGGTIRSAATAISSGVDIFELLVILDTMLFEKPRSSIFPKDTLKHELKLSEVIWFFRDLDKSNTLEKIDAHLVLASDFGSELL